MPSSFVNADLEEGFEPTVVCYQEVDDPLSKTVLQPSAARMSLPDGELSFTLTNRREEPFYTVTYRWNIWKRVDGEWFSLPRSIAPTSSKQAIGTGESHRWRFSVDNSDLASPIERIKADRDVTVRGLGNGTYAFLVWGGYGSDGANGVPDDPISYAAQVSLEGPALELHPPSTANVTKDGETKTITFDGEDDPTYTYTLTRDSNLSADPIPVVTEQLYGRPVLRAAMAHFEDDTTHITVKSDEVSQFASETIRYDGETYVGEGSL
jgi:hypothetical protein